MDLGFFTNHIAHMEKSSSPTFEQLCKQTHPCAHKPYPLSRFTPHHYHQYSRSQKPSAGLHSLGTCGWSTGARARAPAMATGCAHVRVWRGPISQTPGHWCRCNDNNNNDGENEDDENNNDTQTNSKPNTCLSMYVQYNDTKDKKKNDDDEWREHRK